MSGSEDSGSDGESRSERDSVIGVPDGKWKTYSRQTGFMDPTWREQQQPHIRAAFEEAARRNCCGQYVRDKNGFLGLLLVEGDWRDDPTYNVDPVKGTPNAAATKQKANGASGGAAGASGGAAKRRKLSSQPSYLKYGWKDGVKPQESPSTEEHAAGRAAQFAGAAAASDVAADDDVATGARLLVDLAAAGGEAASDEGVDAAGAGLDDDVDAAGAASVVHVIDLTKVASPIDLTGDSDYDDVILMDSPGT